MWTRLPLGQAALSFETLVALCLLGWPLKSVHRSLCAVPPPSSPQPWPGTSYRWRPHCDLAVPTQPISYTLVTASMPTHRGAFFHGTLHGAGPAWLRAPALQALLGRSLPAGRACAGLPPCPPGYQRLVPSPLHPLNLPGVRGLPAGASLLSVALGLHSHVLDLSCAAGHGRLHFLHLGPAPLCKAQKNSPEGG